MMNEETINQYYEQLHNNEKVIIICTGYNNRALDPPRLIDTIVIDNTHFYILAAKYGDDIEIHGDFKYKGNAVRCKYGSADIWTLNIPEK